MLALIQTFAQNSIIYAAGNFIATHFKIIQANFQNVDDTQSEKFVGDLIKRHNEIAVMTELYNDVFRFSLLVNFLYSMLVIGLMGYQVTSMVRIN